MQLLNIQSHIVLVLEAAAYSTDHNTGIFH